MNKEQHFMSKYSFNYLLQPPLLLLLSYSSASWSATTPKVITESFTNSSTADYRISDSGGSKNRERIAYSDGTGFGWGGYNAEKGGGGATIGMRDGNNDVRIKDRTSNSTNANQQGTYIYTLFAANASSGNLTPTEVIDMSGSNAAVTVQTTTSASGEKIRFLLRDSQNDWYLSDNIVSVSANSTRTYDITTFTWKKVDASVAIDMNELDNGGDAAMTTTSGSNPDFTSVTGGGIYIQQGYNNLTDELRVSSISWNGFEVGTAPAIDLSISNLDFGTIDVGSISNPQPVVLSNTGSASLNISSISVNSDFIETNDCNNFIQAGSSCTINVSFVPTTEGNITGTLTILSDAASSPTLLDLSGTGNNAVDLNVKYERNFDDSPLGLTTQEYWGSIGSSVGNIRINNGWGAAGIANTDLNKVSMTVVDASTADTSVSAGVSGANANHGKALQIRYPADVFGKGIEFGIILPDANEYYLAYDVYHPVGFDWQKGGKLPGLACSPDKKSGGDIVDGSDGSSARLMWHGIEAFSGRGEGSIVTYAYHVDWTNGSRNQEWNNTANGQANFSEGVWERVEQRIKLNSVGQANGISQAWINGVMKLDLRNVVWRTASSQKVDTFYFSTFYGGGDSTWSPASAQFRLIDNITVSTSPITH